MKKLICLLISLSLAGCSFRSAPANFYRLDVEPSCGEKKEVSELGVGPIAIAPYLNRQQIVTQSADYQFKLNEKERWIEPLSSNIKTALIHGLENELQFGALYSYPWLGVNPSLQLKVSIEEFHCRVNSCALSAEWTLIDRANKGNIISNRKRFVRDLPKGDFTTKIEVMSKLLSDLTKEMAKVF